MLKIAFLLVTWHGPIASPAIHEWFSRQFNSHGQWCCDQADGREWGGDYSFLPDGGVELSDGRKIEGWKVLSGPNPTGHPILWSYGKLIFCFAPGTLS